MEYLKRRLREAGSSQWEAIAESASADLPEGEKLKEPFLRKIAYDDRNNPGIKKVQPLLDYFQKADRAAASAGKSRKPRA
jgi:hypothetical protein